MSSEFLGVNKKKHKMDKTIKWTLGQKGHKTKDSKKALTSNHNRKTQGHAHHRGHLYVPASNRRSASPRNPLMVLLLVSRELAAQEGRLLAEFLA